MANTGKNSYSSPSSEHDRRILVFCLVVQNVMYRVHVRSNCVKLQCFLEFSAGPLISSPLLVHLFGM
jgi:hypothetical protein